MMNRQRIGASAMPAAANRFTLKAAGPDASSRAQVATFD